MSPIEVVASVCGLLSVIFTVRRSLWCWPTGLAMVALYIVIFWEAKLYSDMGLQVVYVFLQIYGWWHWARGGPSPESELPVRGISGVYRAIWSAVALLGTAVFGWLTATYTDAALPFPDALIAALSLVAQWLMGRKVWESWVAWIVVDLVAVPVYASKQLYLTAGLYTVFLGLAVAGLVSWRRAMADDAVNAGSAS